MSIINALITYKQTYPKEASLVDAFLDFLEAQSEPMSRSTQVGHLTACVWIRSFDHKKVLLVDHKKLGKWVQLGGHIDAGETPLQAAEREAYEESGLKSLRRVSDDIFDLDIHDFPQVGDFPAHKHLDIRYLYEADGNEVPITSPESHAVHWVERADLHRYTDEESVLRLARKG